MGNIYLKSSSQKKICVSYIIKMDALQRQIIARDNELSFNNKRKNLSWKCQVLNFEYIH